jgi:hypothetical protein
MNSNAVVPRPPPPALPALPSQFLASIDALTRALGIPRSILAGDDDIAHAWSGLPRELAEIPANQRGELVARMCVAVSVGLFDGAINYIWNAAILRLREKVRNFGLPVVAQIRTGDFEEKHLVELQDSQLLDLCLELNLVQEDGFFFLDQCRSIRNNYSAAHPALGNLNDREFITFLNRCVRYALGESSSPKGVDIAGFIQAIKGIRFTANQCGIWVQRLEQTHDAQRQMLVGTMHGIYCDPSVSEPSRLNALDIGSQMKGGFTAALRTELVNRHCEYTAKGDEPRRAASLQFFEKLGLVTLLNESEQHAILYRATEFLWNVHLAMNNFYNEPPFAERLLELSRQMPIPETVREHFVTTVICCFVGNGYGVCHAAVASYEEMIRSFAPSEIQCAVQLALAKQSRLRQRIDLPSCRVRFKTMLSLFDAASIPKSVKAEYDSLLK